MDERSLAVRTQADAEAARRAARRWAQDAGLTRFAAEEFTLAVMELATNLVRHATAGGSITLRTYDAAGQQGVEVISADEGPGIEDLERAMAGGHSTAGGLGCGLSAVHRLLDRVEITASSDGTTVTGQKRLDR